MKPVVIYSQEEVDALDDLQKVILARSFKLYVCGWSLSEEYKNYITSERLRLHYNIELAVQDGIVVGSCMNCAGVVHVFVRAAYRRMGIGTYLVNKMKSRTGNNDFHHGDGIIGSANFWNKVLNKEIL